MKDRYGHPVRWPEAKQLIIDRRELAEMNECDKRRYCGEKVPKPSLYNSIALKSLNRDLAKE